MTRRAALKRQIEPAKRECPAPMTDNLVLAEVSTRLASKAEGAKMHMSITSNDLPDRLRASLIDRSHPAYEEARALYNAMIDKRPRWIVRCAEVADVVAAVHHAREKHLLLAICGGGHNGPGFGVATAAWSSTCRR
jgi:hypothetical protein